MLDQITPLILTYNEEPNLSRLLSQLGWARRVVVLDSMSTDATVSIARSFPNVVVIERKFDLHAQQWNYGVDTPEILTPWILSLDADYGVSEAVVQELSRLQPVDAVSGYSARFRYLIQGEALSGSLYPPVIVLFRRGSATYRQEGHTQRLVVTGEVRQLSSKLDHDDRKPLSRWLASQHNYAELEATLLSGANWSALRWQDRLRKMLFVTPWLVPLYALFVKRCALDGRAGWYYALQRGIAEAMLALKLLENRWGKK